MNPWLIAYVSGLAGMLYFVLRFNPPTDVYEVIWAILTVAFWPLMLTAIAIFVIAQDFIESEKEK